VVDGAEPIGERGDRSVVGDVHDFGADPRIVGVAIGIGQFGFVSSGDNDLGSL
jgi:hypothetical protein